MALPGGQVGNESDMETEPQPVGPRPQKGGLLLLCSGPGPRSPFVAGTTGPEVPALAPAGLTPRGQPCARLTLQPHAAPRREPRAHTLDHAARTHSPLNHHPKPGCAGVGLLLVLAGRTTLPQVSLQLRVRGGPDALQVPQHTGQHNGKSQSLTRVHDPCVQGSQTHQVRTWGQRKKGRSAISPSLGTAPVRDFLDQ